MAGGGHDGADGERSGDENGKRRASDHGCTNSHFDGGGCGGTGSHVEQGGKDFPFFADGWGRGSHFSLQFYIKKYMILRDQQTINIGGESRQRFDKKYLCAQKI
jgi:hypothetical protein